jgi:hypothetical protein
VPVTLQEAGGPLVDVTCQPSGEGWRCTVRVGDDTASTEHVVTVDSTALARLAPGASSPEELVAASFRFLLEREPREAIMRAFELPIISRYLADYEAEVARRLA